MAIQQRLKLTISIWGFSFSFPLVVIVLKKKIVLVMMIKDFNELKKKLKQLSFKYFNTM